MQKKAFQELVKRLGELTPQQRQVVENSLSRIADESKVCQELNQAPVTNCPHCDSQHLQKWGWKDQLQRYRCKACRATFNRLTGTNLSRLRKKEQWLDVIESLNAKETLDQMQERLGISRMTAVLWRKRFLGALNSEDPTPLSGIVEADETYIRRGQKGSRCVERAPRKRGKPGQTGGVQPEDYVCLMTARDRSRQTAHHLTQSQTKDVFEAFLNPLIAPDSILCSDGQSGYEKFARKYDIQHVVLRAKHKEFVHSGVYHIQNVNAYHSRLKQFLSRLKGVAAKYIGLYLTWLDYLDKLSNLPQRPSPRDIFKNYILST